MKYVPWSFALIFRCTRYIQQRELSASSYRCLLIMDRKASLKFCNSSVLGQSARYIEHQIMNWEVLSAWSRINLPYLLSSFLSLHFLPFLVNIPSSNLTRLHFYLALKRITNLTILLINILWHLNVNNV